MNLIHRIITGADNETPAIGRVIGLIVFAVFLIALPVAALLTMAAKLIPASDWAMLLDAHGAIHDVYVDATFRRAGVAKALMLSAIAALEAQGADQVVLSTSTSNPQAQALFRSLGFRDTMIEMTRSK